jgi:hypothetical protein
MQLRLPISPALSATCLAAALALWLPAGLAQNRALIMGIGHYQKGNDLSGVPRDLEMAREIAASLGVAERDMTLLSDQELTLNGLRQAFSGLVERTEADDRVFIYYTGHGGRTHVDLPAPTHCAEALVSQDNRGLFDHDISAYLGKLTQEAEKLVFFLDSCFSGGATSRGYLPPGLLPKYGKLGDSDSCGAANLVDKGSRFVPPATRGYANNYVHIAASRPNEVSYQFASGSVATLAWLECLNGRAVDSDGSGAITAEEIRACAQPGIDQRLPEALRHHITLTGNARMALGLKSAAPSAPEPVVEPSSSRPASAPAPARATPYQTLLDLQGNRDGRRSVALKASKRAYRIGRDSLELTLDSDRAGQVYLFLAGSDGRTLALLFPNAQDHDNRVEAGETLRLPRPGWELPAQGPAGTDQLLAVVVEQARNFSAVPSRTEGPFSLIETDVETAAALQKLVRGGAYGAAMVSVEEVE